MVIASSLAPPASSSSRGNDDLRGPAGAHAVLHLPVTAPAGRRRDGVSGLRRGVSRGLLERQRWLRGVRLPDGADNGRPQATGDRASLLGARGRELTPLSCTDRGRG